MFVPVATALGLGQLVMTELRQFTLLCAVPILVSIPLFLIYIPESPMYLLSKNKRDEARKAIGKFRNIDFSESEKALKEIELFLKEINHNDENIFVLLKNYRFRRALITSSGLFVCVQFVCGVGISTSNIHLS